MTATRILALALASASVAAISAAHAVPQGFRSSGHAPRLTLIPPEADGDVPTTRGPGCGGLRAGGMGASGGFLRGADTIDRSGGARSEDISQASGDPLPVSPRSFLRIIPRSGIF